MPSVTLIIRAVAQEVSCSTGKLAAVMTAKNNKKIKTSGVDDRSEVPSGYLAFLIG